MKKFLLLVLTYCPLILWSQDSLQRWQKYNLEDLIKQQEQSQKRYLPFLREPTISAGIYELQAGATDNQQPHELDEVYFIISGKSNFSVEQETTDVGPGDVLFVRANLKHHFSNITEDLKVLVWFSGSSKTDHDFLWKKWSSPQLAIPQSKENSWNVFLKVPTLITGLYVLPQEGSGDSMLTHQVDQIIYVTRGRAKMGITSEVIEVGPGSIVYLKSDTAHRFFGLKEDFAAYIMFEQR